MTTNSMTEIMQGYVDVADCIEDFNRCSMVWAVENNMMGFKRFHRHESKEFHGYALAIEQCSTENFGELTKNHRPVKYSPANIKEHFEKYVNTLDAEMRKLQKLNKDFFNATGTTYSVAQDMQQDLFNHIMKWKRWYRKLSDQKWEPMAIYMHDKWLHDWSRDKHG